MEAVIKNKKPKREEEEASGKCRRRQSGWKSHE